MVQYNGFSYTHSTNLYCLPTMNWALTEALRTWSCVEADMVPALSETK